MISDVIIMVLEKVDNVVKAMISDTILALCRNTLPYQTEVCVEGLLGVTVDNKEVFLVHLNETILKEGVVPTRKRTIEKQTNQDSESSLSSGTSDSESNSQPKSKRKRKRKRKSSSSSRSKVTSQLDQDAHTDECDETPQVEQGKSPKTANSLNKGANESGDSRLSQNDDGDADDSQSAQSVDSKVKKEKQNNVEENSDDLVFIKEEPKDFSGLSYGQSPFTLQGSGESYGSHGDQVALGHLQELAMQISSDTTSMGDLNTMVGTT